MDCVQGDWGETQGEGGVFALTGDDINPTMKKSFSNLLDQRTTNLSSCKGSGVLMTISSPL